ncbi:MAG: thioredoxin family protein [Clostridia bacterium]|nr:thioredoxin family protein [Clostridia bacterium]
MSAPAIVIDDKVVSMGRVPTVEQIETMIRQKVLSR